MSKYDIILTHTNKVTGAEMSDSEFNEFAKSIASKKTITTACKGKKIIINPEHIVMVVEE